jgi:lysozyme
MQARHRVTRAAIDLIKAFEGYRRAAARLPDGRWTIGYSHTLTAREGAEVSEKDAGALLAYDLIAIAHSVNEWTYAPLTQNQFDALCAFAFNVGLERFRGSSVLRHVNEGQYLQAACAMDLWRKADFEGERIIIDALVRRRAAEKTLFLMPVDGWVPAPSAMLRPSIDFDIAAMQPRQTPAVLTASLNGLEALAERMPPPAAPSTATQRAAAAVAERLQTIVQDEPPPAAGPQEIPQPVSPEAPPGEALASATERSPLPPPTWPLTFGATERAFELTHPTDHDFDTPVEPETSVIETTAEAPEAPTLFDAPTASTSTSTSTSVSANDDETIATAEALTPPVFQIPMAPVVSVMDAPLDAAPVRGASAFDTPVARPAAPSIVPVAGLGGLGMVFFVGGLFWSANAGESSGLFNPWIVGTLICLAGVGFMAFAVHFLLLRLGRVDADAAPDDEAPHH